MTIKKIKSHFESLLERVVGLPLDVIRTQDEEQTERFIEARVGRPLTLGCKDSRVQYRGNPLLAQGRIMTHDVDAEFCERIGFHEGR